MNQKQVWNKIADYWNKYKTQNTTPIAKAFLKNAKGKVLDLGCGSGRNFIKTKAKIYGVDFSEEMLKHAKNQADKIGIEAELTKANASKLPFKENYFNKAIAIAVLHCIKGKSKRQKTINELYRVLKPNAKALISVWNKKSKRWKSKPKEITAGWTLADGKIQRYYYIYDYEELEKELKKAGFKVKHLNFSDTARNIVVEVQK